MRRHFLRSFHSLVVRQCIIVASFAAVSIVLPLYFPGADHTAVIIVTASVVILALLSLSLRHATRTFRESMRQTMASGDPQETLENNNLVPELDGIAREFDDLVSISLHSAKSLRELAENNAHSLKGPVATIQSALDVLSGNVPEEAQNARRAIDLIRSAIARLRIFISTAQRPYNISANVVDTVRVPIDVSEQLGELMRDYRIVLNERGVDVILNADRNIVVLGSKTAIQVAIENVIENAIGFGPPGSMLAVRLYKDIRSAHLLIEDEGPGVDADFLESIFDRHVSHRGRAAPPSQTAEMPHSGLGLWISRRNIEALGGTIFAANRTPRGLSVHIILPMAEPATVPDADQTFTDAQTANETF